MINVNVRSNGISIKGHAGADEYGKDIVCASASILFYTLLESAKKMERMKMCDVVWQEKSGDSFVYIGALSGHKNKVQDLVAIIANGYEVLAENYPEYVSVESIEK